MGTLRIVAIIAQLIIELLVIFALIDAIRRPSWQWEQAYRSRGKWIALLILGIILPGSGFFIAIAYYFFPQPALKRADRPIGFPGTNPMVT